MMQNRVLALRGDGPCITGGRFCVSRALRSYEFILPYSAATEGAIEILAAGLADVTSE